MKTLRLLVLVAVLLTACDPVTLVPALESQVAIPITKQGYLSYATTDNNRINPNIIMIENEIGEFTPTTISEYTENASDFSWSPDGKNVAFFSWETLSIIIFNLYSLERTNLTGKAIDYSKFPAWSPDGKYIAFSGGDGMIFHVYLIRKDGSESRQLTNSDCSDENPAWSPDGKQIVFQMKCKTNNEHHADLYKINIDDSSVTRLTDVGFNLDPSWSPDGRKIAYSSNRNGNFEIYTMNADGSGSINLTNNPGDDFEPAWSLDGKKIAFWSVREGNLPSNVDESINSEIFIMNVDGTELMKITNNGIFDSHPQWKP